jgi:hypothetical protein
MSRSTLLLGLALLTGASVLAETPPTPRATYSGSLTRVVAVNLRGVTLEDALKEMEKQASPIRLQAVRHLRERRMALFARGQNLGSVLPAISAVWSLPKFPAKWERLKGEVETYELRQAPEAANEGERRETVERGLVTGFLAKLKDLPADDTGLANKSLRVDPRSGDWNAGWSTAVGAMIRDIGPSGMELAARGEDVPFPPSAFSAETRELLFRNIASHHLRGKPLAGVDPLTIPFDSLQVETPRERRDRFNSEPLSLVVKRDDILGIWVPAVRTRTGDSVVDQGVAGPPIGFSDDFEEDSAASSSKSQRKKLNAGAKETPLTAAQRKALTEAATERKITSMADFESLLHRITGRTIAADYYSKWQDRGNPFGTWIFEGLKKSDTLEGFLDSFTPPPHYRWRRRGTALSFRSRMWWVDDEGEISPTITKQLTKGFERRGYLNLEELASAAMLSEKQLRTLRTDFLPEETVTVVETIQPWMRLYASLPPIGRAKMRNAPGLLLGELPEANLLLFSPQGQPPAMVRRFQIPQAEMPATRVYLYQEEGGLHPHTKRPWVRTWVHLTWPGRPEGRKLAASQVLPQPGDQEKPDAVKPAH